MADNITKTYAIDIDFRTNGPEQANTIGYKTQVSEINEGIIYKDDKVSVEAFLVRHGSLECYGYKFMSKDKTIVISGDTASLEMIADKAKDVDILLHEVEYSEGLKSRDPKWYEYHKQAHTLSVDLAKIAAKAKPKLLVTTHRIYHMNIQDNTIDLDSELNKRDKLILEEIRNAGYDGKTVNGKDIDIFE